jgi:hypothetical protein
MAENQLTPGEARAVSRVLASVATVHNETLGCAIAKLAALADNDPPAAEPNRYVGLVVFDSSGVPEVVCGEVALVDFNELDDASRDPRELEELAETIETDPGGRAVDTVSGLRQMAHARRVQRLEESGKAEPCLLSVLQSAVAASAIDPDRVVLLGARVEPPVAVR